MRVRRADVEDGQAIAALQVHCFGELIVKIDQAEWWIVQADYGITGFAGLKISEMWRNTVYLCLAGVHQTARGKGLQKRLIRARLNWAKANGMEWAYTDTRHNPASANSLISCGFKMYEPQNPWSFKDACYWRKQL